MREGDRLLVVPAAGRGSRLGGPQPKLLVPVFGRPMIDFLLDLYQAYVGCVVIVLHPDARAVVGDHLRARDLPIEIAEQQEPTGMLDAVLEARPVVERRRPSHIWVTWCDQVAVHPGTVRRLAEESGRRDATLVLPTVRRHDPYIHLDRDDTGRITRVLHRREGDTLPDPAESDIGLFSLSLDAYLRWLPAFAAEMSEGARTGERNFLPFIPWLAARAQVDTFAAMEEMESVGVNTPDERALVERYLAARGGP